MQLSSLYFSGERLQNSVFEFYKLCTMALYWARQDFGIQGDNWSLSDPSVF